jgi:hypothetical protein
LLFCSLLLHACSIGQKEPGTTTYLLRLGYNDRRSRSRMCE